MRRAALAAWALIGLAGAPAQAAPQAFPGPEALPQARAAALAGHCEAAAARAAAAEDVPLDLLRAIALAETGLALSGEARPWPWTVNMEGEGRWFASPHDLLDWVEGRRREGARSFDLGCFQVNHLWHGEAFASLREMVDPEANALYAARFLRELREETGSWEAAAGLYHSRTPDLAARYRGRVLAIRAKLGAPHVPSKNEGRAYAAAVDDRGRRVAVHGSGGVAILLLGLAAAESRLVPMNESGRGLLRRGQGLLRRGRRLVDPQARPGVLARATR